MPFTFLCVCHKELGKKKKFSTIFFAQHNDDDEKFSGKFFDKTKKKNLCKFFILHAWSPFIQPNQNQTNRFPFTYFCCCCCFEFCQNRQKKNIFANFNPFSHRRGNNLFKTWKQKNSWKWDVQQQLFHNENKESLSRIFFFLT